MKNKMSKSRKVDNPYMIYQTPDRSWEWRVLKTYQTPEHELTNQYARWFCAVKSPMTYGDWEYGDVYCKDIKDNATCVKQFEAQEIVG